MNQSQPMFFFLLLLLFLFCFCFVCFIFYVTENNPSCLRKNVSSIFAQEMQPHQMTKNGQERKENVVYVFYVHHVLLSDIYRCISPSEQIKTNGIGRKA